jgi:hypothetical protein
MDFSKYVNTVAYPSRSDFIEKAEVIFKSGVTNNVKRFDKDAFYQALDNYNRDQKNVTDQFKADLLEELGITNHPKAELLFNMAWEEGHSEGYQSVFYYADMFSELLEK